MISFKSAVKQMFSLLKLLPVNSNNYKKIKYHT